MATNNDIRYCLETHLASIPLLPVIFNENLNNFPQDPVSHISTRFVPTSNRAVNPFACQKNHAFHIVLLTKIK